MNHTPSALITARIARAALATLVAPIFAGPTGLLVARGGDIGGPVPGTDVSLLSAVTFYGYLAALLPMALTGLVMVALASRYASLWVIWYWALAGSMAGLALAIVLEPYLLLAPSMAGGAAAGLVYRLILGRPHQTPETVQVPVA